MRVKPWNKDVALEMRAITKPFAFYCHRVTPLSGGDYVLVRCASGFDDCYVCDKYDHERKLHPKREMRLMGIIDRATGGAEIIRLGPGIFYTFQKLHNHLKWGDPKNYDMWVKIDEHHLTSMSDIGPTCINAFVVPRIKTPLSEEDIAIKNHFDLDELKAKCKSFIAYETTKARYKKALAGRGERWFNFESGCKNEKQKAN